ncbi:MAG: hypothetical protein WCJ31_14110 [Planctomycetia bacterium]
MKKSTTAAKLLSVAVALLLVPALMAARQTKPAAAEEFLNRLACVIKADGSIARGFMIDKSETVGVGDYVITWKVPLQGEAKTNFSGTIGSAMDEAVEPGLITVGLMADKMQMRVRTYDPSGKPAPRPFHIGVFRDR